MTSSSISSVARFLRPSARAALSLAALSAALSASGGCVAPTPVVRLSAETPNARWVAGRETVVREDGGVQVATAFERGIEGTLAIRLEVLNQSEETFDVSPQNIWFNYCGDTGAATCAASTYIKDPEVMLAAMDEGSSRQRAAAENSQRLGTGLILLSAAAEAGDLSQGRSDHAGQTMGAVVFNDVETSSHANAAANLDNARAQMANVALRRSTVAPGQSVSGEVYVPVSFNSPYVRLTMAIGARRFTFVWRQETLDGQLTRPRLKAK